MRQLAVDGFRAEREAILTVARDMSAEEWLLPSACAGWTIRDVMGHMACTLHGVIDPAFLPDTASGTERAMEPAVAERRTWPIEAVIEEYETYSEQAADVFASVQDAPLSETMLAMGELGTHPMSILPSTFLFDGYTHLRNDILTPNGSIDRAQPPRDEMRLRPTIEWMIAGLPWMCADALDTYRARSASANVVCGSAPARCAATPTLNVGTSPVAIQLSSRRHAMACESPSCAWRRTRNSSPP